MTLSEALATLEKWETEQNREEQSTVDVRMVRAMAHDLADWAEEEGGTAARLALWRRMFQAGVFQEPPLSGAPYDAWCELHIHDVAALAREVPNENQPFFSVLMPVYNPVLEHLAAAIESVLAQSWTQWELCVADDCSSDPAVHALLRHYAAQDVRVKLVFRQTNGHISEASNTALAVACAPWCALMDHDDVLAPNALAVMADAIVRHPQSDVFFSDEDQFEGSSAAEGTQRFRALNPMFKHGFDPDLLLSCNCVSHLGVYRTLVLRAVGGFRKGLEGAQDHDLALRCLARAETGPQGFCHVPGVLYHWRRHAGSSSVDWAVKPYVREASLAARRDYAAAVGLDAEFSFQENSVYTDVRFKAPQPAPLLSLCLLATDGFIPAAVRDLVARTHWQKREILLLVRQQDKAPAERVAAELRARVLVVSEAADEWQAANTAAHSARGKVLAFVRVGDIPLSPDWCDRALGALYRSGVAVVGCRSVTKDGFLHHAGYAVERTSESNWHLCPAYGGLHTQSGGYFHWAHLLHSVMGVPLSGMFCQRSLFEEGDGFATGFGDLSSLDFCMRAYERQQRCVIVPDADLLSFRSIVPLPIAMEFKTRWGKILSSPPYQNPYLNWTPGGWKLC